MDTINYTKKFDGFYDGFKELTTIVPEVAKYIEVTEDITEATAIEQLMNKYNQNLPVSSNPNFPYTYSFKSDSFGTSFGTDTRLTFGWKAKRTQSGDMIYIFRVTFPNANTKSTCEHTLSTNEWQSRVIVRNNNRKTSQKNTTAE